MQIQRVELVSCPRVCLTGRCDMKHLLTAASAGCGWLLLVELCAATGYAPGQVTPPEPPREFRGVWMATVNNIDWPSKPGLPVAQQKTELRGLLERAQQLRLNAILFQVRPGCDALYASSLEPWSDYLTGEMGRAPQPLYDPLQFLVEEAHRRGLELHAWFNPFRARHSAVNSAASRSHISRTRPELVRTYGKQLWLDPGEAAAQDHSLRVILDVVRRYDVDGVHIDDYFYPYPEKDAGGNELDFPDNTSWARYLKSGGKLSKSDWRRNNVDRFVHRLYEDVKAQKSWIKVGVSPFGIWRPGFPSLARGFDAYEKLYADSRRWLASGWMDYCAPQLYWSIAAPNQSYPMLLQWWREQNSMHRHLWPGNSVYRAGVQPGELESQIRLTRLRTEAPGNLLWSMKPLQQDKGEVGTALARTLYNRPALVPAFPWLDAQSPARPSVSARSSLRGWTVSWQPTSGEAPQLWVFQSRTGLDWNLEILPGSQRSRALSSKEGLPTVVAVRAVDRCGNLSSPSVLVKSEK
jgi:uncharacterized lipoprotein YddW (UPF0748 family)